MRDASPGFESRPLQLLDVKLKTDRIPLRSICHDGENCSLDLDFPAICVSCDNTPLFHNHHGRRTDFIIATDHPRISRFCWVIVEMKSSKLSAGELRDQIQAGIDVIGYLTPPAPSSARLVPLVLHAKGAKQVNTFIVQDRYKIRFHGKPVTIVVQLCGIKLSDIVAT